MKPPTDNHWRMIDFYSKKCDYVVVILSNPKEDINIRKTENGSEIKPTVSKDILTQSISDSGINNVKVVIADDSPVTEMLKYMNKLSGCDIVLGVGKKDGDFHRYDSLVNDFHSDNDIKILDVEENAFDCDSDYSATDIRNNINDKNYLKDHLPQVMSNDNMEKSVSIL